ncbi:hypothetical protein [Micromonospora aurantiaca (nom. illeg.)]|uniref:hypothetical protein n=1 Tax=Micromonospora aurantiaca (nom. illeg.) TaxID=47850 RepID=UPI0011A95A7F|nr:hypothetical protein [Micromonospora aurantiaca]MBC9000473.1 hypothetical protein [Micromonospora aurantiaca]
MNPAIHTYRARLAEAAERAGPDRAITGRILAGELRAEHRKALGVRDRHAAALHFHHGWSWTQLCTEIHGRPNKVAQVREAIEKVTPPRRVSAGRAEEAFKIAQVDVRELWALYKQARALANEPAVAASPDADVVLDLPDVPIARLEAAAGQLETTNRAYADAVEARNRAAAALTKHAGWSNRQAAQLAGAAVRDIYPHQASAPRSEADPELVAERAGEVRRLAALRAALTRARDGAIRELSASMGPAELARLARLTDERVVQIRDAA